MAKAHAKVIDFGIAKLVEGAADAAGETRISDATGDGVVLGTTTYMSPKQARGDRVDVIQRSAARRKARSTNARMTGRGLGEFLPLGRYAPQGRIGAW